jgi:hypothetical protein
MDIDKFMQLYNDYYVEDIIINIKLHIGYNVLINYVEYNEEDIINHIFNNKDYYLLLSDKYLTLYGDMFNQINEIVYVMFLIICDSLVDIKSIIIDINEDITMEQLNNEIYNILNIVLVFYNLFIENEENYLYIPDKLKINNELLSWEQLTEKIYKKYNKEKLLEKINMYKDIINSTLKISSCEYDLNEELINSLILYFLIKNLPELILKN